MIPSSLFLSSLYLAYLPHTTAWFFSWTQPNGKVITDNGNQAKSCQAIDNPEGNIFDWSADGDHVCIYLYNNSDCAGRWAGYTCQPWPWDNHPAGSDILSYVVVNNGTIPSSVASTTPPATTTTTSSTSTTSATATATSSPTSPSDNSGNGSSLSGGAIAGIVVGVLAAAAIAGILFFFLGWRRRRQSNSVADPAPSETAMSELQAADDKPHQEPPPSSSQSLYQQQQQQRRLGELPGSHVASEMGPGVERAELDGSPVYGKF